MLKIVAHTKQRMVVASVTDHFHSRQDLTLRNGYRPDEDHRGWYTAVPPEFIDGLEVRGFEHLTLRAEQPNLLNSILPGDIVRVTVTVERVEG